MILSDSKEADELVGRPKWIGRDGIPQSSPKQGMNLARTVSNERTHNT